MRLYNTPHRHYAGVDLHARTLYAHVLDADGRTVLDLDRDLPTAPAAFLDAVTPMCMLRCGTGPTPSAWIGPRGDDRLRQFDDSTETAGRPGGRVGH